MEEFRHLRVHHDACDFARRVWQATRGLPWQAQRLVIQLDDACESIGSNIAEGCGRKNAAHGNAELIRYNHFSFGSANEADHRLTGLLDRQLISQETFEELNPQLLELKRKLKWWTHQLARRDRGRIKL